MYLSQTGTSSFFKSLYLKIKSLETGQLNHFVDRSLDVLRILSTCSGKMRLAATAALDQFCSLAYNLSGVQLTILHHVVTQHHKADAQESPHEP